MNNDMFRRAPRLVRSVAYALSAGLVVHVLHGVLGLGIGLPESAYDDWVSNAVLVGAALVCLARAVLVPQERAAWALIGFGLGTWSAADIYSTVVLSKLDEPPYPSIADAGWLLFYPAFWVALVLLLRRRVREFHASLWLDGIVAALGMAACAATIVLPPILAMSVQGDAAAVAVNLAYPAGDVLLIALLVGALALTGWRPDRSLTLIGLAVCLSGVADMSYLDAIARGEFDAPAWANSLWPAGAFLTAVAAWQPAGRPRRVRLEGRRLLVLPLGAMVAALALLGVDHFSRISHLGAGLAFATLLVAGARLWLTLGEHMTLLGASRGEATTDPLTGLRNRRALVQDLDDYVVHATPEHPLLLLLFDLNGFKAYNDTYGHQAGDALLGRLGAALARAVDGHGHAYRIGGDEFCVLAPAPEADHAELGV